MKFRCNLHELLVAIWDTQHGRDLLKILFVILDMPIVRHHVGVAARMALVEGRDVSELATVLVANVFLAVL
ncbi:MAG: hypothetical protein ACKOOI_04995, partial [Pirellula sp.]